MIFTETNLPGAYVIDLKKMQDQRGFFGRAWCQREFEAQGLVSRLAQANISFNHLQGTLRGMHYQIAPFEETKLVRCTKGAIYDVIIDLRLESPTYKQWVGVELTAANYKTLYVPEGFAHGYQTLENDTEVFYQVSQFYAPESERGIRYNDSAFGIKWPLPVKMISDKDKSWPDYENHEALVVIPSFVAALLEAEAEHLSPSPTHA
jgi:dTDP-4-dehydrorhamnose 3,5-epimerase